MNWLREPDSEPIPGYVLVEPIGTGGFGEVWKCVAPGGIHKAIKFVYGNLNSLDGDDVRAEQEQKALQRVKNIAHPFVCQIDRIDVVSGELVIVMELAEKTLHDCNQEYQAAGRPGIPRDMLLGFLDDAAVGLDFLIEKHNLQHLDVKPRNLFLVAERVKVADFGLVKHLERSSSSGLMGGVTPIYAAPETFSNKISKHSDQYSLAVVYVELLTGKRPFNGKNIRQLALQHMQEPPDLSMIPEDDRPVVAKALAKNPDERYSSCTAFIRALSGGGQRPADSNGSGQPTTVWTKAPQTLHDVDLTPPAVRRKGGTPTPTLTQFRPDSGNLHVTRPDRDPGVLRPTVLIGVGAFGRRALQEVRCRLVDRVGDVSLVPVLRLLYVDPDPDAVAKAVNAPPDVALTGEEVFPVPLQPVTGYRRRQLEQVLDWLPREKLYSIPRNLQLNGSRALGRLAFCDNYLRFVTRFRREIQVASHPESVSQSADQTGLPTGDAAPRVYVFASAAGGSGGMLLDLGHAVRRVLARLNAPDAAVTAFLFAGAPTDTGSPDRELANLHATLTELNHYADPDVTFTAQYGGPDGPRVEGQGLPFTATYLLPMAERTGPAFQDCVSHLAGYVAHDLTTPLGAALDAVRRDPSPFGLSPFRGFGTYGVWFPRGLLLRAAAYRVCRNLVSAWVNDAPPSDTVPVDLLVAQVMGDPRLKPDAVARQIEQEATRGSDGGPADQIERWLTGLDGQVDATSRRPDSGAWARNVWEQAREFVGTRPTGDQDSAVRRSRVSRQLEDAIRRAAEMWGNEFTELTRSLEDHPGHRLAGVELALGRLADICSDTATTLERRGEQHAVKSQHARADVQAALDACRDGSGTFSFFGGRPGRSLRHFLDQLRTFARLRLHEDMTEATAQFYRKLRTRVEERVRDLQFCRARLEHLLQSTNPVAGLTAGLTAGDTPFELSEEALQQTLHPTNTLRVVLPAGDDHIDRSASRVAKMVRPADVLKLEHALQKLVLEPRGGLTAACHTNTDLARLLFGPLVEQTTAFLAALLPSTDVTEVEASACRAKGVDMGARIEDCHRRAAPPCGTAGPGDEHSFVVVPDSDWGKQFAADVRRTVPVAKTVPVQGAATDLMFCREHGCMTPEQVRELMSACVRPYWEAQASQATSPHARFDVAEWLPLNE